MEVGHFNFVCSSPSRTIPVVFASLLIATSSALLRVKVNTSETPTKLWLSMPHLDAKSSRSQSASLMTITSSRSKPFFTPTQDILLVAPENCITSRHNVMNIWLFWFFIRASSLTMEASHSLLSSSRRIEDLSKFHLPLDGHRQHQVGREASDEGLLLTSEN